MHFALCAGYWLLFILTPADILCYMSQANVTPELVMEQETISAAMEMAKPTVCVIGAGGAGGNIVSWIKSKGISGGKLIAVNTDAAHLGITKADRRMLIGPKLTQGRGCGGYPEKGMQATRKSLSEIIREVQGSNIILLCAGLGGGTGTGAIQILAKLSDMSECPYGR
jgi:cell division protein FtsZ